MLLTYLLTYVTRYYLRPFLDLRGACMRAQWSTHGSAHSWRGILSESHCGERDTRCAQLLCGLHEACPVDGVVRIALGLLDDQFRPEFPLTFPEPVLRMPWDAHVRRNTPRERNSSVGVEPHRMGRVALVCPLSRPLSLEVPRGHTLCLPAMPIAVVGIQDGASPRRTPSASRHSPHPILSRAAPRQW